LIYNKLRGFFAKFTGIIKSLNYFPLVKFVEWVHGAVDRRRGRFHDGSSGWRGQSHGGTSSAQGALGSAGLQSSPPQAGEGDEAVLMRGSPEHGRRQKSGVMMMEDGGGSFTLCGR
jgi:hypothetical protein